MRKSSVAYLKRLGLDVWVNQGTREQYVNAPSADVRTQSAEVKAAQPVVAAKPESHRARDVQRQPRRSDPNTSTAAAPLFTCDLQCVVTGRVLAVYPSRIAAAERQYCDDVVHCLNAYRPAEVVVRQFQWPPKGANSGRADKEPVSQRADAARGFRSFARYGLKKILHSTDTYLLVGPAANLVAEKFVSGQRRVVNMLDYPQSVESQRQLWQQIKQLPDS